MGIGSCSAEEHSAPRRELRGLQLGWWLVWGEQSTFVGRIFPATPRGTWGQVNGRREGIKRGRLLVLVALALGFLPPRRQEKSLAIAFGWQRTRELGQQGCVKGLGFGWGRTGNSGNRRGGQIRATNSGKLMVLKVSNSRDKNSTLRRLKKRGHASALARSFATPSIERS